MANTTGKKFGGRVKNTPNKTTANTKAIIQKVVSEELDNLELLLAQMTPSDRVTALIKLLPFVVPKQSEISIDAPMHQLQPITLNLIAETLKLEEHG